MGGNDESFDVSENELVTPPLESEVILPGVVRKSILALARSWGDLKVTEREIDMQEVVRAQRDGRVRDPGSFFLIPPNGEQH